MKFTLLALLAAEGTDVTGANVAALTPPPEQKPKPITPQHVSFLQRLYDIAQEAENVAIVGADAIGQPEVGTAIARVENIERFLAQQFSHFTTVHDK